MVPTIIATDELQRKSNSIDSRKTQISEDEVRIYRSNLRNPEMNKEAISFIQGKYGWSGEVIEKYRIGMSEDQRVTFPNIVGGRVVYLTSRAFGGQEPRWQNCAGKKSELFLEDNLSSDWLLLCEGVPDAISADFAGFPAVSAYGAKWSEALIAKVIEQCKSKRIVVLFDPDAAGINASKKLAEALLSGGCEDVKIATLPTIEGIKNNDVAEYMKTHSRDELQMIIDVAIEHQISEAPVVPLNVSNERRVKLASNPERARNYVATMDPAIQGAHGENQFFHVCYTLAVRFDLSEADTESIISNDYNPRCQPPFSEKEVAHKIRDAYEEKGVALESEIGSLNCVNPRSSYIEIMSRLQISKELKLSFVTYSEMVAQQWKKPETAWKGSKLEKLLKDGYIACDQSYRTLSDHTGIATSSLVEHTKKLVKSGLVHIEKEEKAQKPRNPSKTDDVEERENNIYVLGKDGKLYIEYLDDAVFSEKVNSGSSFNEALAKVKAERTWLESRPLPSDVAIPTVAPLPELPAEISIPKEAISIPEIPEVTASIIEAITQDEVIPQSLAEQSIDEYSYEDEEAPKYQMIEEDPANDNLPEIEKKEIPEMRKKENPDDIFRQRCRKSRKELWDQMGSLAVSEIIRLSPSMEIREKIEKKHQEYESKKTSWLETQKLLRRDLLNLIDEYDPIRSPEDKQQRLEDEWLIQREFLEFKKFTPEEIELEKRDFYFERDRYDGCFEPEEQRMAA